MNVVLWIVQILLAVHTLIGAFWKFGNLSKVLPFANSVPEQAWIVLAVFEILCSILLIAPLLKKSLGRFIPLAALGIAAEMAVFSILLLNAAYEDHFPLKYWIVVAVICAFVAYGRRFLRPVR